MKSQTIPKAKLQKSTTVITKPKVKSVDEPVSFSFASFEQNEFFNLDGTCNNWASDLFLKLKEVSTTKKSELLGRKYKTYRVHSLSSANLPCPLPNGISKEDVYQIRIGTSKGGIHGIFVENVFYIIWLDPLHNMYPDDRYGGLRKIKPPSTCCKDREKIIDELTDKNVKLTNENEELMKMLDEQTKPN